MGIGYGVLEANVTNPIGSQTLVTSSFADEELSAVLTPTKPTGVGEKVKLSVITVPDVEVEWEFGDEKGKSFSKETSVEHIYSAPGNYTLLVRVRRNGETITIAAGQVVHSKLTDSLPGRSGSIVFAPQTNQVWVANPDNGTVTWTDKSGKKLGEQLVGMEPRRIAVAPDGNIWACVQGEDKLVAMNGSEGNVIKELSLPYGAAPFAVTMIPGKEQALVSLEGSGRVLKVDTKNKAFLTSRYVGETPRAIAITADGKRAFVARFISNDNHGEIFEIDPEDLSVTRTIPLQIDLGPDNDDRGRGLPNYIMDLAIHPDGKTLVYTAKKDNIQRGTARDGKALNSENTVRSIMGFIHLETNKEDVKLRRDFNERELISAIVPSHTGNGYFLALQGQNQVLFEDAFIHNAPDGDESAGSAPRGICLNEDGTKLYVHSFLSRELRVYDVTDLVQYGMSKNFMEPMRVTKLVSNEKLSNEELKGKQLFYFAGLGEHDENPKMTSNGYISCATCHLDGSHDGRTWDFTDRGEGLRNTITLHGRAGMEHGPVHWTANFDEIHDFENDIRLAFLGLGFMSDDDFDRTKQTLGAKKEGLSSDLDALAAYVSSLKNYPKSPFRKSNGSMTEDAIAGKAIFNRDDVGCAVCHRGVHFTDSKIPQTKESVATPAVPQGMNHQSFVTDQGFFLHNVGTIRETSGKRLGKPGATKGFDTPTLLGVWQTAPYLHDGSAETLMEVVSEANANDRHGKTSHLTQKEKEHLVAFLQQLDGSDIPSTSRVRRFKGNSASKYYQPRTANGKVQRVKNRLTPKFSK